MKKIKLSKAPLPQGNNQLFTDLRKYMEELPKDYWIKRHEVAMKVMKMMMNGEI